MKFFVIFQVRLVQLSFGVWLVSWAQTITVPWALADGQAPSASSEPTLFAIEAT